MGYEVSRRTVMKSAGGLILSLGGGGLLAACGGTSTGTNGGTSSARATVSIANGSGALALDPRVGADEGTFLVKKHVFSTVTKVNPVSGAVTPLLAAELPSKIDEHTWQVKLRPNVAFQDGSVMTAADLAFTLNSMNSKSLNSLYTAIFGGWSAKVKDDSTVVITLEKPFAALPARLGILAVVPEKVVEKVGNKAFGLKPVGTGPFDFVSWPGASQAAPITLKRAAKYSLGSLPSIGGLSMTTILDDSARINSLLSGASDICTLVAPNLYASLSSSVVKAKGNGSLYDAIMMNNNKAPFDDKRVRMAVAHAIDREAIIKTVWDGLAMPAYGPLPPWHWASNPNGKKLDYDVAAAKSLLAQAGYSSGGPRIELMFANSTTSTAMGTIVTSQLQAAGFKVTPKTGEVNSLYSSVFNRSFQAYAFYGNTGLFGYDPDIWYRWLYYGSPGTFLNVTKAQQAPIDEAIDNAAAIGATDREAQKNAYFALQDMLTNECEMVHIDTRYNTQAWSKSLHNYSISVDDIPDLNAVTWG
jgi:peptide/nickel transport system substrate-binding protein